MMEYNYVFLLAVENNSESMLNQGDADGRTYMNDFGDEYPISEISIYILFWSAKFNLDLMNLLCGALGQSESLGVRVLHICRQL